MRSSPVALILLVPACYFGSYDARVPFGRLNYAATGVAALAADHTALFVFDQTTSTGAPDKKLKSFDATTGAQIATKAVTSPAVAVAPDWSAGNTDKVWVQHADGTRSLLSKDLATTVKTETAIPLTGATAATSRTTCDMDRATDGTVLVTTVDVGTSSTGYLYRRTATGTTWSRTAIGTTTKCSRVAFDAGTLEAVVLDPQGQQVLRYDAALAAKGTLPLAAVAGWSGTAVDLASVAGIAVIAADGTGDALHTVDVVNGTLKDTVAVASAYAVALELPLLAGQPSQGWAWWTGYDSSPIKYTSGRFELVP